MKIKYFNLGWKTSLLRFYLMMLFVIVGVFSNIFALALLAFPVFLSIMLGMTFKQETVAVKDARMITLKKAKSPKRAM